MISNHINYIEFKANDLVAVKAFYTSAFHWTFVDYGPDYVAFAGSGVDGGFERTEEKVINGALTVLYHEDLNLAKQQVIDARGTITKDIFSFPGGHRFHFADPSGNELAVWSDK